MCTSATGKSPLRKTALVYLGLSVFCIVFTNLYALFGHGVRSFSMDFMFLYPLLGGALPFFTLSFACPRFSGRRFFRPAYNLYNSGLAALGLGAMLQGIVEIAGTGSEWIRFFTIFGSAFILAGILLALKNDGRKKE